MQFFILCLFFEKVNKKGGFKPQMQFFILCLFIGKMPHNSKGGFKAQMQLFTFVYLLVKCSIIEGFGRGAEGDLPSLLRKKKYNIGKRLLFAPPKNCIYCLNLRLLFLGVCRMSAAVSPASPMPQPLRNGLRERAGQQH